MASMERGDPIMKARLRKTNYPRRPYGGFDPLMKQIFDFIDERRISHVSISLVSGIDPKTLASLRRGQYNPRLTSLQRLLKALGCEVKLEISDDQRNTHSSVLGLGCGCSSHRLLNTSGLHNDHSSSE